MAAVPSLGRATEVEGSAAPEAEATHALYECYAGQIYSFCLHRLGSREEAEDAVQTTFLNAFRGLRRGIVPEAESAWLFKIAENVCLTRHRSAWRRGRVEAPSDMQALQDVLPARERNGDELIPLGDALAAMPETQRRAILLREWQGLSYREIADEMGVSQSAVETLIFRARRSLANALEMPRPERPARRVGRRAFDLGSLLAGLKGLLAGSTAAKVAVIAVAAVTGTIAFAVAELGDASPPAGSVEPSAGALRAPDSLRPRPALAPPAAAAETEQRANADVRARAAGSTWDVAGAATSSPPLGASGPGSVATESQVPGPDPATPPQSERPEMPPGQAEDPGTPAVPPGVPEPPPGQAPEPTAPATPPAEAAQPQAAPDETRPKPKKVKPKRKPKPKPEKPKPDRPDPAAGKPSPAAGKPTDKPDEAKPEKPKAEAPKPEPPRAEAPKPDTPKPDTPKPDTPKPDTPKPEEPTPAPSPQPPPQAASPGPEPKDKEEKGK